VKRSADSAAAVALTARLIAPLRCVEELQSRAVYVTCSVFERTCRLSLQT